MSGLRRHHLAGLAKVVRGVDDVVVAAPRTGADGVVAGPRDAREVGEGAVVEHRAVADQAAQVRDRVGVVLKPVLQLRVALAIEQEDVHALRTARVAVIDDLLQHAAVLPLQVHVRRHAALRRPAAGAVLAIDQREAAQLRDRRRDIDLARWSIGQDAALDPRPRRTRAATAPAWRRARRAAPAASERVRLRVDDEIGRVRATNSWRCVRTRTGTRCAPARYTPRWGRRRGSRTPSRPPLFLDRGERLAVLVAHRVLTICSMTRYS